MLVAAFFFSFSFFLLRLEIGFVHKPPTQSPRCSSPTFIQKFHSRFLSIALLHFHGSSLPSPLSAHVDLLLLSSPSFSGYFASICTSLSRPASLLFLTFSPGKVCLGSRLILFRETVRRIAGERRFKTIIFQFCRPMFRLSNHFPVIFTFDRCNIFRFRDGDWIEQISIWFGQRWRGFL